ncbi:MAG: Fpg/Nei family DNA glycosylase [Acidimicrobiales bacterium]
MPELPEVSALAAALDRHCAGKVVDGVQLASLAALKTYDPPLDALSGTTVGGWSRRGKYLCMNTDGPCLVVHLARGGWVRLWDTPPTGAAVLGTKSPLALRLRLAGGTGLDITEMGTEKRLALWVVRDRSDVEGIATLGPEPLDPAFDCAALGRLLAGEKGTLKSALARQSLVAGIGNAYSDEILHAAQLSPYKGARSLSPEELDRVFTAMKDLLGEATERAMAMAPHELKSEKKRTMRVHGREGQACPQCGDVVRSVSFATKSLQYCATCQTGGKALADRRLSRLLK